MGYYFDCSKPTLNIVYMENVMRNAFFTMLLSVLAALPAYAETWIAICHDGQRFALLFLAGLTRTLAV